MKVQEIMKRDVRVCSPDADLATVGKLMDTNHFGVMPVTEKGKVIGMITDRDICVALAKRDVKPSKLLVREVMSHEVHAQHPDHDIKVALETMRRVKVRRLPVVDDHHQLQGILSLDDVVLVARAVESPGFSGPLFADVVLTLRAICQPAKKAA